MNKLDLLYLSTFVLAFCIGCDTHHPRPAKIEPVYYPEIKEGITTREDILFEYGAPSMEFESGRILTFRLALGDKGLENPGADYRIEKQNGKEFRVKIWYGSQYNLIVVFDNDQRVKKWALLQVR